MPKKQKSIILINIILTITILVLEICMYQKGENAFDIGKELCYMALIIWIYCIISSIICKIKITNIYFIYLLLYFIFIFGQMICKYIFNFKDEELDYLTYLMGNRDLNRGMILAIYCMLRYAYRSSYCTVFE